MKQSAHGGSNQRLKGKVCIVTGAGNHTPGLSNGGAIATLFAAEGARVVCVTRSSKSMDETLERIRSFGGEVFPVVGDVSVEKDVERIVSACLEKWQRIDILVNNVGIPGSLKLLESQSVEDFEKVMKANVTSMFLMSKAVVRKMKQQESGGSIVNISSIAGVRSSKTLGAYSTSKGAVNMLTKSFAIESAPFGIRVNTIVLGMVKTPMVAEAVKDRKIGTEELHKSRDRMVPLKMGQGTGMDTAYASLFLASDESRYITGSKLVVDGGLTIAVNPLPSKL